MSNRNPVPPGDPSGAMSRSTFMPLLGNRSNWATLAQKGQLIPVVATVVAAIGLFQGYIIYSDSPAGHKDLTLFSWIVALYITSGFTYFVYRLGGHATPWWLLVGVALVTFVGDDLGLFHPFYLVGDKLGAYLLDCTGGPPLFCGPPSPGLRLWAGFAVGLREEAYKALPVLVLAAIAAEWRRPWIQGLGVFEPLDGILLGVASGAGFTLMETMGQYFHDTVVEEGAAAGLMVLMFRLLGELGGHLAYSGYFGYFIGLAVLRRRDALQLLLVGLVSAAILHGLWDSLPHVVSDLLGDTPAQLSRVGLATLSYGCLAAAVLKAREISPTRAQNFATRFVAAPGAGAVAAPGAWPIAPPMSAPAPVPHAGTPSAPARPGALAPMLTIGAIRFSVAPGLQINPESLGSAGAGRGPGPVAEVTANPNDPSILGLRNLSQQPWQVATPNGNMVVVETGRTIRLDIGTTIDFGGIKGRVQDAP